MDVPRNMRLGGIMQGEQDLLNLLNEMQKTQAASLEAMVAMKMKIEELDARLKSFENRDTAKFEQIAEKV